MAEPPVLSGHIAKRAEFAGQPASTRTRRLGERALSAPIFRRRRSRRCWNRTSLFTWEAELPMRDLLVPQRGAPDGVGSELPTLILAGAWLWTARPIRVTRSSSLNTSLLSVLMWWIHANAI